MDNVNYNANLMKNILSYLKPKDLAKIEEVNKTYKQNAGVFNHYWREECVNYFCSDYGHHDLICKKSFGKKIKQKVESIYCQNSKSPDWKYLFLKGVKNRSVMKNKKFDDNLAYLNIEADLKITDELFYSTLKEFFSIPKLRRENIYLENDLNSVHQTHNYEFLYEQQDLYDYYHDLSGIQNGVKREDLPFTDLLKNIMDVILFFKSDEDKTCLSKLRWYNYDFLDENLISDNPIIFVLNTIFDKIKVFCQITYNYISKYENLDNLNDQEKSTLTQVFLNEFLKRSKSYFESASYINEEMENLNVLVNSLYENIFPNMPSFPKFSVYRLMVTIWNEEVLHKLINQCDLVVKVKEIYSLYLKGEFEKVILGGGNMNQSFSSSFSSVSNSFVEVTRKEDKRSFGLIEDDMGILNLNTSVEFIINEENNLPLKQMIEQAASVLIDSDCNEYSVYYVNHSKMKVTENYSKIEKMFNSTLKEELSIIFTQLEELADNNRASMLKDKIFQHLKDFEENLKFFNKTKLMMIETITTIFVESSFGDLVKLFQEYLKKNFDNFFNLSEKDAENYFKLNNRVIPLGARKTYFKENEISKEFEFLFEKLSNFAQPYVTTPLLSDYITILFLKDLKHNNELSLINHNIIKTIEDGIEYKYSELSLMQDLDKKIIKENKRRNIKLEREASEEKLLKYEPVVLDTLKEIKEINEKIKSTKDSIQINSEINFDLDLGPLSLKIDEKGSKKMMNLDFYHQNFNLMYN